MCFMFYALNYNTITNLYVKLYLMSRDFNILYNVQKAGNDEDTFYISLLYN